MCMYVCLSVYEHELVLSLRKYKSAPYLARVASFLWVHRGNTAVFGYLAELRVFISTQA